MGQFWAQICAKIARKTGSSVKMCKVWFQSYVERVESDET